MSIKIQARGGRVVDLENLTVSDIHFPSIFTTLSYMRRFNSQADKKTTVLDHSILAKTLAWMNDEPLDVVIAALLHDAAEAFIGDIVKPLKDSLYVREIKILEGRIDNIIFEAAFGHPVDTHQLLQDVRIYDQLAFTLEVPYAFSESSITDEMDKYLIKDIEKEYPFVKNVPTFAELRSLSREGKVRGATINLVKLVKVWNEKTTTVQTA